MHKYIHTYIHINIYIYIKIQILYYIYLQYIIYIPRSSAGDQGLFRHTYIHTYLQTDVHACVHTYIHTYLEARAQVIKASSGFDFDSQSLTCVCVCVCVCSCKTCITAHVLLNQFTPTQVPAIVLSLITQLVYHYLCITTR